MPFVRLAFFPQGTAEHYDALGPIPDPPGRLLFAAGPVVGGWQVVQVWESPEQLAAFNRDVFLPAWETAGDSFPHSPRVTDFTTADYRPGR